MHRPPLDPRNRAAFDRSGPRSLLVDYALMGGFLLSLWLLSHPAAGAVVLAALVGLVAGTRRASRLLRCFRDCGGFSIDLAGRVRITVAQPRIDDAS